MSAFTNLDLMGANRYELNSRSIELEKALEGAYLDESVKGARRSMRDMVRERASFDWSRYIDRRAA
jgi:hypothetical protein